MGERLANKIYEIVDTGRLRRLENVDKKREGVIDMFTNVHGVGQITAQKFYAQVWHKKRYEAFIVDKLLLIAGVSYTARPERCQCTDQSAADWGAVF